MQSERWITFLSLVLLSGCCFASVPSSEQIGNTTRSIFDQARALIAEAMNRIPLRTLFALKTKPTPNTSEFEIRYLGALLTQPRTDVCQGTVTVHSTKVLWSAK